jgi:hypothetical protein
LATWIYYMWPNMTVCKNTRVRIHAANCTRVKNTRGQLDACTNARGQLDMCINIRVQLVACIHYTRLCGRVYFIVLLILSATLSSRHVASCLCVYSNRYCWHAANCFFFCTVDTQPKDSYELQMKNYITR